MKMHVDAAYRSLNKYGEELCGDKVKISRTKDSTIAVLADGLGSGVKANILSTLTSSIISTMLDEGATVEQAVETILFVDRFRWQIYSPYSGVQWGGLVGQDPGYVAAELKRRISEALKMDDRIIGLGDFTCSSNGDVLTASLTVQTVYGDVQTVVEVNVS